MRLCGQALSGIDTAILRQLDRGPFAGIAALAEVLDCTDRRYVRERLRRLQQYGILIMDYPRQPCRGRRVIIKKAKGR